MSHQCIFDIFIKEVTSSVGKRTDRGVGTLLMFFRDRFSSVTTTQQG